MGDDVVHVVELDTEEDWSSTRIFGAPVFKASDRTYRLVSRYQDRMGRPSPACVYYVDDGRGLRVAVRASVIALHGTGPVAPELVLSPGDVVEVRGERYRVDDPGSRPLRDPQFVREA